MTLPEIDLQAVEERAREKNKEYSKEPTDTIRLIYEYLRYKYKRA